MKIKEEVTFFVLMHDQFIRAILSDKAVAADYFQAFLPETIRNQLDFSTLTHLPETYLSEDLRKTMSDIVYECQEKRGRGTLKVCLLVEHKSYPDKYTPVQLGSYIFSALQKQVANKETLMPVIPVLLYHGKGKWEYRTLTNLFPGIDPDWKQFIPDFSYVYNNLGEVPDESVEILNNQFLAASLLALKHAFEQEWLLKNALRVLLMTEKTSDPLQKKFMVYFFGRSKMEEGRITYLLESVSLNTKNNIMSVLDFYTEKGIEKGIEKGKQEANLQVVKKLLTANRFTIAEIANFANVTEEFVLQVKGAM